MVAGAHCSTRAAAVLIARKLQTEWLHWAQRAQRWRLRRERVQVCLRFLPPAGEVRRDVVSGGKGGIVHKDATQATRLSPGGRNRRSFCTAWSQWSVMVAVHVNNAQPHVINASLVMIPVVSCVGAQCRVDRILFGTPSQRMHHKQVCSRWGCVPPHPVREATRGFGSTCCCI